MTVTAQLLNRATLSRVQFLAWKKAKHLSCKITGLMILDISSNGDFAFPLELGDGANYRVTVKEGTLKQNRVCEVEQGEGLLSGAGVTNVEIACAGQEGLEVASGASNTCAIVDGAAKCWGGNFYGQLGNGKSGSGVDSSVPVQVSGLTSGVTDISTAGRHSCAVHNGSAKCWGENSYGALGNGTTISSAVPVQVSGLTSGVTAISAGGSGRSHSLCYP